MRQREQLEVGLGHKLSKLAPSDILPQALPQGPMTSPNNATNDRPRVQIPEPMEDSSHFSHAEKRWGHML